MSKDLLDEDLVNGLKAAKSKRCYFALVLKGSSDGALIVSKVKVPPASIAEAKKSSGGSAVIKGFCSYEDGKYIFETGKPAATTAAQAVKTIAKRDAGLAIHPEFRVGTDPELLEESEGSETQSTQGKTPPPRPTTAPPTKTGPTIGTRQQPPTTPPNKPVPLTPEELEKKFTTLFSKIGPDYQKAIASAPNTVAGELKSQFAIVKGHYQSKEFSTGIGDLEKLAKQVDAALKMPGVGEGGGVEIDESVAEGLGAMFDEESGPYQYQAARTNVMLSFEPAVKLLGSLQTLLDKADGLAEGEDYDAGVKELEKVQAECNRVLDDGKRRWAVKQKEFFEYRKMGERLAEVRAKKVADLEEKLEGAEQGKQTKSIQEFKTQLRDLQSAPDESKPLNDLYKEARDLAAALDYDGASKKLEAAAKIGAKLQENMNKLAKSVALETQNAEGEDKAAFDIASKTKDKNYGFDSDADAKNFFVGAATNDLGGLVPSDTLKKMYAQVDKALGRLDQLISAGMDPESAGDIAFKNIPKNFWPDRVVREAIMYRRARATFEEEERAKLETKETQDMIDSILDAEDKGISTVNDMIEKASGVVDPDTITKAKEKIAQGKKIADQLGIQSLDGLSDKAKKALSSEKLKSLGDTLGDFATDFGYGADAMGVLIGGAKAIKSGVDASKVGEDEPVKKKLMEFKRNKAILDAVNKMIDVGLGLDEICPALKIASGGKEMVQETIKAVMYFMKLAEISGLKADAKMDPETMMALPLARMARNQGIRASQATVNAVLAAIDTSAAAIEMSGIASAGGVGLHIAGKALRLGSKVVFSVVNWADARRCTNTMKKAAGPPPIRKAQVMIFKNSTKYATFALAYGAVEGNDPWAIQYLVNGGLTEDDLKSPATSVEIVREYMLTTAGGIMGEADVEEDDPTILPGQRKKGIKDKAKDKAKAVVISGAKKVRDKVVGRDTSKPFDATWKAAAPALTRANWQEAKKGAIAAGWYDTRSGLGDFLTAYMTADATYQKTQNTETVVVVDAALGELTDALTAVGTMANDQKTPHQGMVDYVAEMYKLVETTQNGIWKKRQELFDKAVYGDLPPEELEQKKAEAMEKAKELAIQKQEEKSAAKLEEIKTAWDSRKHKTPYGNATLPDFVGKAAKELGLDPEETMALAGTTISISEECIVQLRSLLSGTPEENFKSELERQAAKLDESLVESLRSLAQIHFEAMKLRLAAKQEEAEESGDPSDDGSKWKATTFQLTAKAWAKMKSDAKKHGLVDSATGIGKALETLNKAEAEYRKNKDDEKNVRLVNGALVKVKEVFDAFKPLNHNQFVHAGMADYRGKMLVKIREYNISLQSERASKKIADKANKVEAEKEQAEINQRNFAATPFTKAAWNTLKQKAIEQGLVDKSTGLAKGLDAFDKSRTAYTNESDPAKKKKAQELLGKAITNLSDKLAKFDPKLRNKMAHSGMAYWRGQMIVELNKIRNGLPA